MVSAEGLHRAATIRDAALPALSIQPDQQSTVYAADGKTVLAVFRGADLRVPVALSRVAKVGVTAVIDTEDHRFYQHGGVDVRSLLRAVLDDASGSNLQGGSTIAQQLVKQLFLTSERKLSRKVREAVLADRLERQQTKNQVLQDYLNTVYLGNGAYGIEAASRTYFGEHASQVTLAQAALLAGMIQNPSGYDPLLRPAAARLRRKDVLARMVAYRDISPAQAAAADASPLPTAVVTQGTTDGVIDYYVQEVRNELLAAGSPLGSTYAERYAALFRGGLRIYTNLVPADQRMAESAVTAGTPASGGPFEQALVAIDPRTGAVRALVGGRSALSSQFDIITQGTRQPGSGFKLFTLLAALEHGYTINDTIDGQSPCAIRFPTDPYRVTHPAKNDEGIGGGKMTLLNATAQSTNCAYIRLAHQVGLRAVIAMAHPLGIREPLPPYPSIVIGSIAVEPIEMAAAYAAVADDGIYHQPTFINRILDPAGRTLNLGVTPDRRVLAPQVAAEADVALEAVVQKGTGTAAALGRRPVAGKTGTTSDNVDAWFNGYTPQLETTVWMGDLRAELPMTWVGGIRVYGGTYPAITWRLYMALALAHAPSEAFPRARPLPRGGYITTPSLVADDVLNHNKG